MGKFARTFEPLYREIRDDIFAFCRAMNFEPTWQQRQVLELVQHETLAPVSERKTRVATKSGQGPGKTTVSVIVGLWRALQSVDALTVVTAPSMRQCKDVWLAEARRLMMEADPLLQRFIEVTKSRVVIAGRSDWGCWTVTASRPEAAQGYHQEDLTFIVEEASGVDREFIEQIKGTLSNPNALLFMIGNPNTRDCAFFDCFNSLRDQWHTLTFNAEDTARDYPHIVSPDRNRSLEIEYGRQSDVYRVRVLGEFPHSDPNCVISSEDLEACTLLNMYQLATAMRKVGRNQEVAKQFGIDFARYGSDESVVYRRLGNAIVESAHFSKTDPADVVDRAYRMQLEAHWRDRSCWYVADATGMGQGIMHKFHRARKQTYEFVNNSRAFNSREFENRITEAWFDFARRVRAREVYIPRDNRLIQQLSTRQYFTNKKGQLVLEKKDDYMKRGFDSPDRADACVMAFYDRMVGTSRTTSAGRGTGKVVGIETR
ncbi:MAG: hypothetical protein ACF8XB_14085 [Planctomycetota bacterium JB042]